MSGLRFGPARVTFSGDEEVAKGFLSQALHLLRTTEERARAGGLAVLSAARRLDDDSYCYVVIAGGISAVHIVAGQVSVSEEDEITPVAVPDMVSGVSRNGFIIDVPATNDSPTYQTLRSFHPTQRCAEAFLIPQDWQDMDRLAIEPWPEFDILSNQDQDSSIVFSQYTKLKPTMYSGMMRQCVQALMGFGKQRQRGRQQISLYENAPKPPKVASAGSAQYGADVVSRGLQIRYDWRWFRTHGIARGADGTLWLVEIGNTRGIVAMPLPLNPYTVDPKFRDYIVNRTLPDKRKNEHSDDDDVLAILDTFGGFPTGEGFPTGDALAAWIRAGRIAQLLNQDDLAPFYQCTAYSSALGWAFNLRGDEAHNTAYYIDAEGIWKGVHYAVSLHFGATVVVNQNPSAAALKAIFEKLRSRYKDVTDAVIWKLDRLTEEELASVTTHLSQSAAAAFEFADSLELTPIATASATCTKESEGYLYMDKAAGAGPIIRFPQPELGLLSSMRMAPELEWQRRIGAAKRCDTVMHVFFAGNELKWVKFFRDPRVVPATYYDDFEACMFIGSWSSHEDGGGYLELNGNGNPPSFYTNDFDDRVECPTSSTDTVITSKSAGYYQVAVSDDITAPEYGDAIRQKRFLKKIETTSVQSPHVGASIAVPFDDREAYYYSVARSDAGRSHSVSYSYLTLTDPWHCPTWRNFPGYTGHWIDLGHGNYQLVSAAQHPDGCGPVVARTAMSPSPVYSPDTCLDYADSGPWCSICENMDAASYHIPEPPLPPAVYENFPASAKYSVWLVCSSALTPLQTVVEQPNWPHWGLHTPDVHDGFSEDQYIGLTYNVLGLADSMVYSTTINSVTSQLGIPNWPGITTQPTYIGVID